MPKYFISLLFLFSIPVLLLIRLVRKKLLANSEKNILIGVEPVINNKYWTELLTLEGYKVKSIVFGTFSINKKNDFDYVIDTNKKYLFWLFNHLIFFDFLILSFKGGFISKLNIRRLEPHLLKLFGIKTIILGYGSDIHMYDRIYQCSYQHVLSSFYPQNFVSLRRVQKCIDQWQRYADFIATAMCFNHGFYRNDIITPSYLFFPVKKIIPSYVSRTRSKICIVHSPNHRIIKGTEYINETIFRLSKDFNIEYLLLENMPNEEVLDILQNKADIFLEKLVGPGYALSAIEAMSFGVPVVGSVNNGDWDGLYKALCRYSFLGECPVVSASIESLENVLRKLCSSPKLLEEISVKSRNYVEKYHSYKSGGIFFNEIFRMLNKERVDLKNFYHPILGEYPNRSQK